MGKRTPARMARLVAQWRASGVSRASFARRHHIGVGLIADAIGF
jgi:hypothetical protein